MGFLEEGTQQVPAGHPKISCFCLPEDFMGITHKSLVPDSLVQAHMVLPASLGCPLHVSLTASLLPSKAWALAATLLTSRSFQPSGNLVRSDCSYSRGSPLKN